MQRKQRSNLPTPIGSLKKQESSRKNIYFCFIGYAKAFDCVDHNKLWKKSERDENTRPPDLAIEKSVCRTAAAVVKMLQLCPTLCNPIDGSPPGSLVPVFLQARTLEWVAISFSNVWKWKVKVMSLSRVPLLATPWTAAYQAPPSMGFSRQEYRSR